MTQVCDHIHDPHDSGGDVRVDGETGEGGVDPRADEALPPHPRLHQVCLVLSFDRED